MDNKIIIEFIMREINDLHTMIGSLNEKDALSPYLVEIAKTKAKSLYQEFILLSQINPLSSEKEDQDKSLQPETKEDKEITSSPLFSSAELKNDSFDLSHFQQSLTLQDEEEQDNATGQEEEETAVTDSDDSKITEDGSKQPAVSAPDPFALEDHDQEQSKAKQENKPSANIDDVIEETLSSNSSTTLNEKYQSAYNSLISGKSVEKKAELPIANLLTAISINDQYLFTRELFNNDKDFYDRSISYINSCSNIHEAVSYMKENFHWKKNETSKKFLEFVKRRFS